MTLVAGLLLAGCGNEKEKDAAKDESGKDTFNIGNSKSFSMIPLDQAYEGFQAALKDSDINAKYDLQIAQGDQNNSQTIAN